MNIEEEKKEGMHDEDIETVINQIPLSMFKMSQIKIQGGEKLLKKLSTPLVVEQQYTNHQLA